MPREIIKIAIIIVILALAGWGIGLLLNKNPEISSLPQPAGVGNKAQNQYLQWDTPPKMQIDKNKIYKATIKTTKGNMVIDLFAKDTPITVNNFIFLARQGFYNNTKFHRIIKNFMIQGGDPTGTGRGGPGYVFDDELPIVKDYKRGIVAMANAGPNTNGSQFFIMTKDVSLPKKYVIFGKVISGFDTLDKIAATPVKDNGMGEMSSPIEDVLVKSIEIIEK